MDPPYPLMQSLRYFYRHSIPLNTRGVGRFKIGNSFDTGKDTLRIVEIVPYGMYPDMHPRLKVWGYYRQEESYVVEDIRGNRRWPRVGYLLKLNQVQ